MRKRIAALLAVLMLAGLMQGCWNYREVDNLMIVAGVAVDKGYEGYKYHLTMDLADTTSAGKDKPVITALIEAEGDSILDAVRNAIKSTGMRLYWANCQIVVIGRDVAEDSILPVIDFFLRDAEPRMTMEVFVSEEKMAKDILMQNAATMSITSFEIDRIYELNEKYQPVAIYQLLYENYNTLSNDGRDLSLASLKLSGNADSKTPVLNGTAVFKKDRLQGFLTAEDSKYMLFVMDRVKGGTLQVRAPTGNVIATLEVFGNKTTVTPAVEGGKVRFAIHTETEAALDELDETEDITKKDKLEEFQNEAAAELQESIAKVVAMMQQQYGLDVFGFGDILRRSDLAAWRQVKDNWREVFKSAKVDISCKVNIRNSASDRTPVKVGGGR